MLGTLCLGYGRRAYADCAPSGPAGTYVCSGSTSVTQSLSPNPAAAPLVVTTSPGFSIATTTGDALDLTTTAAGTGLSFADSNISSIAGNGYGINATNSAPAISRSRPPDKSAAAFSWARPPRAFRRRTMAPD